MNTSLHLSRIDKLFLDRDGTDAADAYSRRERYSVVLACGADVGASRTLQLAVLTATAIASRCFPGAVRVALHTASRDTPQLAWPKLDTTFENALSEIVGQDAVVSLQSEHLDDQTIVFGDVHAPAGALRVTYDGWIAQIGPVGAISRLPEREFNPLAGVLAAALALSETFLSFAEMSVEARRRVIAFSLWRPELKAADPEALGVPVAYLPRALWVLGLGHLGNAYAWAVASLPYADPAAAEFALFDFDKVEVENMETGLLFSAGDEHRYKTRVCSHWLERRGFRTKLVERRFDDTFSCQTDVTDQTRSEPQIALCGFDSNTARHDLQTAGFARVVESGLGGTAKNFDTISLHTLPNPRTAEDLWPIMSDAEQKIQKAKEEQTARENPGYVSLGGDDCGRALLAGKAVAVPFVGVTAACLVVAEVLRLLHDGMRYTDARIRLGALGASSFQSAGPYGVEDLASVAFVEVK